MSQKIGHLFKINVWILVHPPPSHPTLPPAVSWASNSLPFSTILFSWLSAQCGFPFLFSGLDSSFSLPIPPMLELAWNSLLTEFFLWLIAAKVFVKMPCLTLTLWPYSSPVNDLFTWRSWGLHVGSKKLTRSQILAQHYKANTHCPVE